MSLDLGQSHYVISHNLVLQYKPVLDRQSDWMYEPSSMLVHSTNCELALHRPSDACELLEI